MKLVDNWREGGRWLSVRFLAVIAMIPIAWGTLPPQVMAKVPESWWPWVIFGLAVGGIAGRFIKQDETKA